MIENHIDLVKSVFREEIPDEYTFKSELSGIVLYFHITQNGWNISAWRNSEVIYRYPNYEMDNSFFHFDYLPYDESSFPDQFSTAAVEMLQLISDHNKNETNRIESQNNDIDKMIKSLYASKSE